LSVNFASVPVGTFTSTLIGLFNKGLRFSTVIDIGSADGNFFVSHADAGLFPDAVPVNIDANALYEPSLRAIKDVFGGHFFIAAASDAPGKLELTNSKHPYWNSVRPAGDLYWTRLNDLHDGTTQVDAITLDAVCAASDSRGPFLLKLDVQGAEVQALRGARRTLQDTDVVICEADIDDFQAINAVMVESGFSLFDVTAANWLGDRSFGWFYPVYLNNRRGDLKPQAFWGNSENDRVIGLQSARRQQILSQNAAILSKHKNSRAPK
jgi:FkbM family methyltransferase